MREGPRFLGRIGHLIENDAAGFVEGDTASHQILGKDALDLLVVWKTWRYAIELKVWRWPTTEAKGLAQLARYLGTLGLSEGWLVIFRNDPALTWDERLFVRTETVGARTIHVVGC